MPLQDYMKRLPGFWRLERGMERLRGLGATDEHWIRVVMNRETRALVQALEPGKLDALEISGNAWSDLEDFKSYTRVDYPEFDICAGPMDRTFDLIIAEQVFEHLLWPYRAGRHVYQMLNPGGHFLVTTPFLVRVHEMPYDCTRWTDVGIRYFLAECGFHLENVQAGSWGNRASVRANFARWVNYHPRRHSLKNERDFPASVWALARK